ncbi:MAG: hypothetical protein HOC23_07125 [Halieaceae bacterium]|nr:hypothetical protein [Halieaceae bacterium]
MTGPTKKPCFFLVGEPKSGTTALYDFLRQHPSIFLPEKKENGFFCKDLQGEADKRPDATKEKLEMRSVDDYLRQYQEMGDHQIAGDGSTLNLFSETAAKEIAKLNADAKIIAIFREPVDFLKSYQQYAVFRMIEDNISLEESIRLEASRKEGKNIPDILAVPSELYYTSRAKYADHLSRYLKVFPKNQILVIIYDDFVASNSRVYKQVLEFLCVDSSHKPVFSQHNRSKVLKSRMVAMLIYKSSIGTMLRKISPKLFNFFELAYNIFFTKDAVKENLPPDLLLELKSGFEKEIIVLDELLIKNGLNSGEETLLSRWNYRKNN